MQHNTVQYSAQYSTVYTTPLCLRGCEVILYSTVQYNTVQCTIHYSVQHNPLSQRLWCNIIQYSTVQYSVQYSTVYSTTFCIRCFEKSYTAQCTTVQCAGQYTVQHNPLSQRLWSNILQYNTIQSSVQCSTMYSTTLCLRGCEVILYSTVQYSTVYSTIQCTAQPFVSEVVK